MMATPGPKGATAGVNRRDNIPDINGNPKLSPIMGSTASSGKTTKIFGKKQASPGIPKGWPNKKQRGLQGKTAEGDIPFYFDVPAHLPNTPQCPASALHTSGGRGVCVVRRNPSHTPEPCLDGLVTDKWQAPWTTSSGQGHKRG